MTKYRVYRNGDELWDALPGLPVGTLVSYHGAIHKVVERGHGQKVAIHIAAIRDEKPQADDPATEANLSLDDVRELMEEHEDNVMGLVAESSEPKMVHEHEGYRLLLIGGERWRVEYWRELQEEWVDACFTASAIRWLCRELARIAEKPKPKAE